jgi:hypothetical protein
VFSSLIFSALADWHAISAVPLWQKTRPTNPPIEGYYSRLPSGRLACHFCPATLAEIPINDENTGPMFRVSHHLGSASQHKISIWTLCDCVGRIMSTSRENDILLQHFRNVLILCRYETNMSADVVKQGQLEENSS